MSSSVLIGIDLGTSKIVALAVDSTSGEIIARGSRPNEAQVTTAADRLRGRSEWDAAVIARTAFQCLRDRSEQLGPRRAEVLGIGITGQQHGMLLLDRALQPCMPLINWQDRRGLETNERLGRSYVDWARQQIGDKSIRRTGCRLQPGFMALTLLWLRLVRQLSRRLPAVFAPTSATQAASSSTKLDIGPLQEPMWIPCKSPPKASCVTMTPLRPALRTAHQSLPPDSKSLSQARIRLSR